jgi:hypothetical protein
MAQQGIVIMWKWIFLAVIATEPAAAATMRAVYIGTIADGTDETGVFGSAGADLGGLSFEVMFVYDTALGMRTALPLSDSVTGGTLLGGDSPVLSVRLTVGQGSYRFVPDAQGAASIATDGTTLTLTEHTGERTADTGAVQVSDFLRIGLRTPLVLLPDLDAALSLSDDDSFFQGSFVVSRTDRLTGDALTYASGRFFTDAVSIAPVPLPAPVTLLGSGLALLALSSSRRRKG